MMTGDNHAHHMHEHHQHHAMAEDGAWGTALGLAFASDTVSIAIMEIVDNAVMLIIPGAMDAGWWIRCSGAAWRPR